MLRLRIGVVVAVASEFNKTDKATKSRNRDAMHCDDAMSQLGPVQVQVEFTLRSCDAMRERRRISRDAITAQLIRL